MRIESSPSAASIGPGFAVLAPTLWSVAKWPSEMPVRSEEIAFQAEFARQFLSHRRAAVLLSVILWGLFAGLDLYRYEGHEPGYSRAVVMAVLALRCVGILYGLIVLRVSFTPIFLDEHRVSRWLAGSAMFTGGLIETMLALTPVSSDYDYYFGLTLLMSFVYSVLHLRARPASLAAVVVLSGLIAEELACHGACPHILPALCFLAAFCLTGNCVAVRIETTAREKFRTLAELSAVSSDLAEAHRMLGDLAERRERMLRAICHDLQQPLAALGLQAFVARQAIERSGVRNLSVSLDDIERAAREIEGLVYDIRDCSGLETPQPSLHPVSVKILLKDLFVRFGPRAREKGLEFRLRIGPSAPSVLSDPGLLRRVLENLVSNAVKYTDHGCILIGCVVWADSVRIDVRDTGRGIPEESQERIFDEFFRVPDPRSPSDGSGLGLAIVRSLIDRLPDHRLSFTSQVGRGSRFSLYCPLISAPSNSISPTRRMPEFYPLSLEPPSRASRQATPK